MLALQNELNSILENIPNKYWSTIIEYAKLISLKAKNGELSDTEYLNNIPGMADSIVKEAATDRSEYSERLDW
jgi:hypothetical protein